jgi:hypothetical protein
MNVKACAACLWRTCCGCWAARRWACTISMSNATSKVRDRANRTPGAGVAAVVACYDARLVYRVARSCPPSHVGLRLGVCFLVCVCVCVCWCVVGGGGVTCDLRWFDGGGGVLAGAAARGCARPRGCPSLSPSLHTAGCCCAFPLSDPHAFAPRAPALCSAAPRSAAPSPAPSDGEPAAGGCVAGWLGGREGGRGMRGSSRSQEQRCSTSSSRWGTEEDARCG